MATPSLFPQFMKAQGGGGTQIINRAIISELEVELATFEAELPAPVVAEIPPLPEAEIPEPVEAETCP